MPKNSVVTIGVFDGVHIGHRVIIKKVAARARAIGARSVVVTFDPHPLKFLSPRRFVPSLISLRHRINLIKELGVDKVLVMSFDKKISLMPAERFVKDVIVKKLNAREVFVGEDFHFGKGAKADADLLKVIGKKEGLKVNIIKHVRENGLIVSSSLIRRLVVRGMIDEASKLLGRPYSVLGAVIGGSRLARKLGYPTANINPHHEVVPPSGVYTVRVKFKKRLFNGIMNIGVRPTFYDHGHDMEPSVEVHIFGFHGNIYGRDLEIIFVKKMRDEKKFKTIEGLIEQIKTDEKKARIFFRAHPVPHRSAAR